MPPSTPAPPDPLDRPWIGYAIVAAFLAMYGGLYLTTVAVDGKAATPASWAYFIADFAVLAILWLAASAVLFRVARRAVDVEPRRWGALVVVVLAVVVAMNVASIVSEYALILTTGAKGEATPWSAFPDDFPREFLVHLPLRVLNTALFLAIGAGVEVHRRFRARQAQALRLQAQLSEARLQALRTQLNPHFLFNALNTVSALAERDPAATRRVVARLSDLLRRSLDESDADEIALGRELDFAEGYLEVMAARFGSRLEARVEAAPDVRSAAVPPFLLQPLVENSVKHGVGRQRTPVHVEVDAYRDGDAIVVTVSDDGLGGPGANGSGDAGGVGLRNTRARLQALYGDRARLEASPRPEGGFQTSVRLPYRDVSPPR